MSGKTRRLNTGKKHERIRALYATRWTNAPRPRKYSREYIIAQLAEEFFLSLKRIEDIIYTKAADEPAAAKAAA